MKKPVREKGKGMATAKSILRDSRRYWGWMIFGLLLCTGYAFLVLYAPSLLNELTNLITYSNGQVDLDAVARLGFILAAIYFLDFFFGFLYRFILGTVANRFGQDMRRKISEKINRLPLSYFDKNANGEVMSRLTNDVDTMSQSLSTAISGVFQSFILLVAVITIMFVKSWILALAIISTVPILMLLLAGFGFLAFPQFRKRQKILGEVNSVIEENYGGLTLIQTFGATKKAKEQFSEPNVRLGKTMRKAEMFIGFLSPAMNFVSYLAYVLVCLVAGIMIVKGINGITYGTLAEFLVYVHWFQNPVTNLADNANTLSSCLSAGSRIYDFLEEEELPSEIDKPKAFASLEDIKGRVEFDHVYFSYDGTRPIITDFSAYADPGNKVAIVGPTGAGKTTMVNLLMRFYEVDEGSIKIDGVNIKDMKASELRSIFGMVLQDTWIYEGTLRENLAYNTPNVTDEDIWKVLEATHLSHYVSTLPGGLDYKISEGSSVSSGERQLFTIARAMLASSPLLILDEATSNVDTRTEERIQDAMDKLMKGRTTFVIAHRLSTIKNADWILVMDKGNIVEQGKHASLMRKKGFYASLYNAQFSNEGEEQQ